MNTITGSFTLTWLRNNQKLTRYFNWNKCFNLKTKKKLKCFLCVDKRFRFWQNHLYIVQCNRNNIWHVWHVKSIWYFIRSKKTHFTLIFLFLYNFSDIINSFSFNLVLNSRDINSRDILYLQNKHLYDLHVHWNSLLKFFFFGFAVVFMCLLLCSSSLMYISLLFRFYLYFPPWRGTTVNTALDNGIRNAFSTFLVGIPATSANASIIIEDLFQ